MPARPVAIIGLFVAAGLAVYVWAAGSDFVRWDDGGLIYQNPAVMEISGSSIKRAFTTYDPELYIPLSLLSYQVDYAVGQGSPVPFHVSNLLLHIINALLVGWLFIRLLGNRTVGITLGLLFLLHPIHTEAVMWASARKDVLSAAFFLGALHLYVSYREQEEIRPYLLSLLCFFLGLLSKVMVITLPAVLILLDILEHRKLDKKMILDKVPYAVLALVFGIVAYLGKVEVVAATTLSTKLLIAAKSAAFYPWKFLVPWGFSVLYPQTIVPSITSPDFIISILAVITMVALAILSLRKQRLIFFAVALYLTTVAPTFINFAKGDAFDLYFASDRYAYLPSLGFLFLVGVLLLRIKQEKMLMYGASVVLIILGVLSYRQSMVWANTETLFQNVLALYPGSSHVAHNNLGNMYRLRGDMEEAIEEYKQANEVKPMARTWSNLGAAYRKLGRLTEAHDAYTSALALDGESKEAHHGLALVYEAEGNMAEAEREYRKAVDIDPGYSDAYTNLGSLLLKLGRRDEAIKEYQTAVAMNAFSPDASYNLAVALTQAGRKDEAITAYERVVDLVPGFIGARINIGILYAEKGRTDDAISSFRAVLRKDPTNTTAKSALKQLGVL